MQWPLRPLAQIQTLVGPCAWRASMLPAHFDYLRGHPSLLVTHPDDSPELLSSLAPMIASFPVMLSIREPRFSRRIPDAITQRLDALKLPAVEIVALFVEDPADLKSGATFQYLYELRDRGVFKHIALAHPDIRMVEWLTLHTPAPVIVMPYHLADQGARHRALASAFDNGMIPVGVGSSWFSGPAADMSMESIRFGLAESARVLPVMETPIPGGAAPMSLDEVEESWQLYSSANPVPAPLPRSLPPE